MPEAEVTFSARLDFWLQTFKMRQSAFARAVGVSQPTVHGWLSGEEAPRIDRLPAIAAAFGITVADFFGPLPSETPAEVPMPPHPLTDDITREIDMRPLERVQAGDACPTCGRHGEAA